MCPRPMYATIATPYLDYMLNEGYKKLFFSLTNLLLTRHCHVVVEVQQISHHSILVEQLYDGHPESPDKMASEVRNNCITYTGDTILV